MLSRILLFVLIAVLSFISQLFMPWWIIAIIAFGIAFWQATTGTNAFWSGFLAIAFIWLLLSSFIHIRNGGILTERIAALFQLPTSFLLIIITALVGGLVGGIAALSGYYVRRLIK